MAHSFSPVAGADSRERLLEATLELLGEGGPSALSARALGERAGVAASAVNYHFETRDGLLAQAFERATLEVRRWRADALAAAPASAPLGVLPIWLVALIQDICVDARRVLVMREFRQLAARWPALRETAAREQAEADAFWSVVCARTGLPPRSGAAVSDFAAGAVLVHGPGADWPSELPWLAQTCTRLVARLAGERVALPGWDGWRVETERRAAAASGHWKPPATDAARRMLEAAIDIVGRRGAEGLTHRGVAVAAGVSLANVTHHYPNAAALMHATFRHLHRRTTESGAANRGSRGASLSPSELGDAFCEFMLGPQGALHPAAMALEELILASTRDPALKVLAQQLRASRGEGSAEMLADLATTGDHPDRLDAHLTSTVLLGSIRGAYGLPPETREAWLRPRARANLQALFG